MSRTGGGNREASNFRLDPSGRGSACALGQAFKVKKSKQGTVFRDVLSATGSDPDHSVGEPRFVTFGISNVGRLLVVPHTGEGDIIRIIAENL